MRKLITFIIALLALLYPVAVYYSIQVIEPWKIAACLLFLLICRFALNPREQWSWVLPSIGVLYCGFAVWHNSLLSLRFYPVLMSLAFFLVFLISLKYPPSIVERIARLQHPDLPLDGVKYTYKVTQVWCLFFLINGLIATATALWASMIWWILYNGLISYLLMGILMGVEYLVRIKTQPHAR
ncbi:MAG: hypothetical protein HFP81_03250 [Methylococcales symbiont of Hymedesmia sp. n. MRB-2018]|nr:MAG: hypothetical protein HFP78_07010 [Methylococcales symbiont of Hymedesmia sp. n. MRB-2018]KAF3984215.1 MAG: hypothetical protein HFP81_03250 [Methylococcales symbiont of Hymedesmia sp. n. MRB-2018]